VNLATTFIKADPKPEVIGQIIWKYLTKDRVRVRSTVLDVNDFLRYKRPSTYIFMTGSDGNEYEWRSVGSEPELWSVALNRCVAYYRKGIPSKGIKPVFTVEPDGETIMDAVIIAFTIIDWRIKDSRAAMSADTGAAAAGQGACIAVPSGF